MTSLARDDVKPAARPLVEDDEVDWDEASGKLLVEDYPRVGVTVVRSHKHFNHFISPTYTHASHPFLPILRRIFRSQRCVLVHLFCSDKMRTDVIRRYINVKRTNLYQPSYRDRLKSFDKPLASC